MIHTVNRQAVAAPFEVVFPLAAEVLAWPVILPHYRSVRAVTDDQGRPAYAMSARRTGFPVFWTALQEIDRDRHEIRYHHVAGVTRGMDVVWRFVATPAGLEVSIDHRLDSTRLWLRLPPAEYVVGTLFVMHVADRTLAGVKRRAERIALEAAT